MDRIRRALRRWREPDPPKPEVAGYWAAPGVGPFAVPVELGEALHDGWEPIRRLRPEERALRDLRRSEA